MKKITAKIPREVGREGGRGEGGREGGREGDTSDVHTPDSSVVAIEGTQPLSVI